MNFIVREIEDRDSLAFFLRKERQEQGYELSEISRKILVAERYLEYLETGDYDKLPGEVYFKNFLKRYVEFLGFSYAEVRESFKTELGRTVPSPNVNQPKLPLSFANFITWPKVLRAFLVSLVALMVFGYLGFSAYQFLQPPPLTVIEPQDNIVIQQNTILVVGETDPSAEVAVNDLEVIVENGKFQKELDLQPGVNEIQIVATKKHGRFNKVNRQVIVTESPGEITKY